jgi:hypothetical protein
MPPNPTDQKAYGNVRLGGVGWADRMAGMGAKPPSIPVSE